MIPFIRTYPRTTDQLNLGRLATRIVPLHQEGVVHIIKKPEIMPSILAKCPAFLPTLEKHQAFWQGKEVGIYNDLGDFATFIVDAYSRQETEMVAAAFMAIEELLVEGDEEVRTAAAIGFLEDVQAIASHRPFGAAVFVQWLGPKSNAAWAEIEEMWRGKSSLTVVLREEKRAEKNKPKS
jgi:hypothetical protein